MSRGRVPRRGGARGRAPCFAPWAAALLVLFATRAGAADLPQGFATPSRLATRSLLLDAARAGPRLVAVGEWGHVILSDDGGRSWRQAESVPTRVTLTDVFFLDGRKGWAVGHDAVILATRDGGERWELQYSAPEDEAPLLGVWFQNADHGIAVGAFARILETHDGGQRWETRRLSENAEEDYHLNQIFAGPRDSLWIAAEFGSIYRSRDTGRTWERLQPPYEGSFWGGLPLDAQSLLVFGIRGHIFRSDDLGETWQAVESGTDQSLQSALRRADGSIVIVGLGGAVLTSRDGGLRFTAAIEADRQGIAAAAEGADGRLLLFGEAGVKTR